jgi:multidrug efflux pump subunit AcrA (membrane-fusion protein)
MARFRKKTARFITQHPLISFGLSLSVLFAIIFVSNAIRSQNDEDVQLINVAKKVQTMPMANGKYAELSAKVEKDGVITIHATAPGIVHDIYVEEGQNIRNGQSIAYLSDTYGGGNSADVNYQIAARQSETQNETFEKRIGIIDDQRDDVSKTNDLTAEIMRKQFTLQKRETELNFDLVKLQEKQAAVNAARYRPTSPFTGVVDRVFIARGDTVSVGDRIAVINADEQTIDIIANMSAKLASIIDINKPSILYYDGEQIEISPRYLSRGAADEQSYVLTYSLSSDYLDRFIDGEYVIISVPIDSYIRDNSEFLVPLDSVRFMSDKNIIFVMEGDVARAREIEVGEIVGGYVFIRGEITEQDLIIVNRNVFDEDPIIDISSDK